LKSELQFALLVKVTLDSLQGGTWSLGLKPDDSLLNDRWVFKQGALHVKMRGGGGGNGNFFGILGLFF